MIIQSRNVYYEEKLQPKQIKVSDGKIAGIFEYNQFPVDKDYGDNWILPGLVDVHAHGYNRGDCNHATREWLEQWTSYLPKEGVTSTLAAISSNPKKNLISGLTAIGEYIDNPSNGTEIMGVYSEGPFISISHRGAQLASSQIIPTKEVIDEFNEACNGHLLYVLMAPEELKGDYSVIDYCRSLGMKVALGHTGADFKTCTEAIEHGACSFTHTYNGMTGLHHREPGVVGAAMYYDHCWAELICDGIHVNKYSANILAKTKSKDKLILVTDAVSIKGLKPGKYDVDGQIRYVCEDGVGRLENGQIAGSCNALNKVLKFAIQQAGIPLAQAINGATVNPCRLLDIYDRGVLARGYRADIVVFDPEFNVVDVYLKGEIYGKN